MKQIILLMLLFNLAANTEAQDWLDKDLYPFEHHYMNLSTGQMHYVEEGNGEVLLFVHGTPAWSFLYRDFIKYFSPNYRCIAIDHIGFGLSEKPLNFEGTPAVHAANLGEFIERMDLQNITLVVHDFGGPIGLSAAITHSNRIKQIVSFNTWLWETASNPAAQKVDKLINSWLGRFLYLNMNLSPKMLLKQAYADKKKLTKVIHKHYLKPFPNKASRQSLLRLAESLVGSSDWYQAQWEAFDAISDKPYLLLWGTKDEFITTDYLAKWKERLPHAIVHELDAGHFVQEEATKESIKAIEDFLNSK